jgi:hypothetical protein
MQTSGRSCDAQKLAPGVYSQMKNRYEASSNLLILWADEFSSVDRPIVTSPKK